MKMEMDLEPNLKPIKSPTSPTKVLDAFPGFNDFYKERVKPEMMQYPPQNMCMVIFGESGVGKETLAAMILKKVKTDPQLLAWQQTHGLELRTFYLSWANSINKAKEMKALDFNGQLRPVIDPAKEHGQYSRYDLANAASLMRHSLLYARRNYHPPCLFIVELLGVVPDDYSAEIMGIVPKSPRPVDLSFSVMRALARYNNTYFLGVVTNDQVQERTKAFRQGLLSIPNSDVKPFLSSYRSRIDKDITDDISGFCRKMGTADAISYVRNLVDREIFYLSQRKDSFKKREEIFRALDYCIPSDLKDLQELLDSKTFPSRRSRILTYYFKDYLINEVLDINPERVLIGENTFLREDIDLYRQLLEDCSLPLSASWHRKWGNIYFLNNS